MSRGRNYTVSERAILVLGLRAGVTPFQINMGLGERQIPASSFAMVKEKYLPTMNDKQVWDYIQNPKSLADLEK